MKSRQVAAATRRVALVVLVTMVTACAGSTPHPLDLPAPQEVTTLGPGDVFELHIVGEEKLPTTFTVAPDGTVDLPYVHRVQALGLEPQQLAAQVRTKLVENQILVDPSVSISLKDLNSKRIEILGEVQKPGSLPMVSGMTLLRAISLAGGFSAMANRSRVMIRRRVGAGTKAGAVSVEDIMANRIPDPLLQAGDSINIDQRVF
ncbi:MAG: polysaccharide biosynthesis/export family protein [Byssovorax sp.]